MPFRAKGVVAWPVVGPRQHAADRSGGGEARTVSVIGKRSSRASCRAGLLGTRCHAPRGLSRQSSAYGRIDILFNVAGGSGRGSAIAAVETAPLGIRRHRPDRQHERLFVPWPRHAGLACWPTMRLGEALRTIVMWVGTFGPTRAARGRMGPIPPSKWLGLRGITRAVGLELGAYNLTVN